MNEVLYSVLYNDVVLAKGMTLGTALLLIEAMMQKYHNECELEYKIRREDNRVCSAEPVIDPCELVADLADKIGINQLYAIAHDMRGEA